jgi:hypothetical protein
MYWSQLFPSPESAQHPAWKDKATQVRGLLQLHGFNSSIELGGRGRFGMVVQSALGIHVANLSSLEHMRQAMAECIDPQSGVVDAGRLRQSISSNGSAHTAKLDKCDVLLCDPEEYACSLTSS